MTTQSCNWQSAHIARHMQSKAPIRSRVQTELYNSDERMLSQTKATESMKKIFIAALLTCIPLALASCGEQNDDIPVPPETTDDGGIYDEYMTADDLVGDWSSWDGDNGSQIVFDFVNSEYTYRTWYGRIGTGALCGSLETESAVQLEFDDFLYDLVRTEDGFTLHQNGQSAAEDLDGLFFKKSDDILPDIPLSTLDGLWQNALGETLVIDTGRMEYIAASRSGLSSGTIYDKHDGRGPYLFLNGFAYPRISYDGSSLELFFTPSKTQTPDGSFSGVFYTDADAGLYSDIEKAEFTDIAGRLWYYDGVNYFAVPDDYTLDADGYAYDENGNIFAAGWIGDVYDPAEDYGDGWADIWD